MKLRINKTEAIYCSLFILLMMVAAFSSSITFLAIGALCLLFVYINLKQIGKESIIIPKLVLALLLFQNMAIGIGAHLGGNNSGTLSWITQVPTLFIAISYLVVIFTRKIDKKQLLFFVYVVLCLVYLFIGEGVLTAKITYLRNFTIFYMAFTLGRYYINTPSKTTEFTAFFFKITIFAVLFGLTGFFLGKSFYQMVGVLEVYKAKMYTSYKNGLPGNFITIFLGIWVNRFASLYYDPVNFSYYMALACLVAYTMRKRRLFFLFLICEILTFGKGGLLVLMLSLACISVQYFLQAYNTKAVRFLIIFSAIIGMIGLFYVIQTYFPDDFGTANHFYGMSTGIDAVKENLLGHGLGTAGNLIKTEQVKTQAISETGLINMAYQLGIFGTGLFCFLFLSTGAGGIKKYSQNKNKLALLCSFLPFVLLVVSIFQENTFTPQCVVPYMLLIGSMYNREKKIQL